ncbi:MAG TPA: response regulator [Stellaceae bacterium]|nr:response regulator [Stellaceae bacterium]
MRLLLVEDEPELSALIRNALERAGFAVDLVPDLAEADDHLALAGYDAIVLDLALPDGDGLSLLRRLRAGGSNTPVLVLTARDGPDDRVAGLDSGADDYLVKPFHMPELVARIRALLRRPGAVLGVTLSLGNLLLDTTTRQVRVDGLDIRLSVRETALLELLLRRQRHVVPREILEQNLYSFGAELGSNAMEVLVHRLRRKLAEANATLRVHTVRGVGYLLAGTE